MNNYDASMVGVPYVRAPRLIISYPDNNKMPTVHIEQAESVTLADGTPRQLGPLPSFDVTLDMTKGDEPIPLLDPNTGAELGINTSLNQVMLSMIAVVRFLQKQNEAVV
jgi:hypothetical protein